MEAAIAEEVVGMRDATSPVFSSHTVEFEVVEEVTSRVQGEQVTYRLLWNP